MPTASCPRCRARCEFEPGQTAGLCPRCEGVVKLAIPQPPSTSPNRPGLPIWAVRLIIGVAVFIPFVGGIISGIVSQRPGSAQAQAAEKAREEPKPTPPKEQPKRVDPPKQVEQPPKEKPAPTSLGIGEEGQIRSRTGNDVAGATDKLAYDQFTKFSTAKDVAGANQLMRSGKIVALRPGTRLLLVRPGIFYEEVRILSGPNTGKLLLVDTENVVRLD